MLGTKSKPKSTTLTKSSSAYNKQGVPNGASYESKATCVVAEGTTIEGQFVSSENVRLDGIIIGDVNCSHRLVMGPKSKITGQIFAKDATIMGTIEGEIKVEATLHLKDTARIYGNLTAQFMIVDDGAEFIGDCEVGQKIK